MSRMSAYSMLTRRPVVSKYALAASRSSPTLCLVLIGTRVSRSSSSGACRLTASVTGSPSVASRWIAGTRPTVETVMWRAEMPSPSGAGSVMRRRAPSTAP